MNRPINGRLLWAPPASHATVWKNPPQVLLCALQPKQIETWRNLNRWADAIDMIIFTDDDPPRVVREIYKVVEYAVSTGLCPHIVVNAPPESVAALDRLYASTQGVIMTPENPAQWYQHAVRMVARALKGKLCAWIQPESDHGIGACTMAAELSPATCVGYSARAMIDSVGALAAGKLGVNVRTLGAIAGARGEE